jgi:hypothetical protein
VPENAPDPVSTPSTEPAAAVETPPPPETPAKPTENLGIAEAAAGVVDRLKSNAEASGRTFRPQPAAVRQEATKPAWMKQPKRNFQTDDAGNILFHKDGKPKKANGRPRKPRDGDELADGTIYRKSGKSKPTDPQPATVIQPPPTPGQVPGQPTPGGIGLEFGEVAGECIGNIADALGGEEAAPTAKEQATITKASGQAFQNLRIHPVIALGVALFAWFIRVKIQNAPKKLENKGKNKPDERTDTHRRRGPHPDGQVGLGQETLPSGGTSRGAIPDF